jgi:hypothetical protein
MHKKMAGIEDLPPFNTSHPRMTFAMRLFLINLLD